MTLSDIGAVPKGTRLNGIYEIDGRLAMGGMGEVYTGHVVETGDRVAIKMILPEHASNEMILDLFRREASTLHNIYHEAIVRYYVFSVDPDLKRPYLAMEYAEGPDLTRRLEEGGPLSEMELTILRQRIAGGLHAAHRRGVIHRDIAPDNVILVDGAVDEAKIIDFGIAKSTNAESTLIGSGFAGKLKYVSPEQLGLAGGEVTAKSDIYSLGLVLAEAAIGRALPMGGTQVEVIEKRRVLPDLSEVPEFIRPLITAMVQPEPADRPADMDAVANWQPETRTIIAPQGAATAAPTAPVHPRAARAEQTGGEKRGTPWGLIGGGAAAVIAAGVGAFVVLDPLSEPAPAPEVVAVAPVEPAATDDAAPAPNTADQSAEAAPAPTETEDVVPAVPPTTEETPTTDPVASPAAPDTEATETPAPEPVPETTAAPSAEDAGSEAPAAEETPPATATAEAPSEAAPTEVAPVADATVEAAPEPEPVTTPEPEPEQSEPPAIIALPKPGGPAVPGTTETTGTDSDTTLALAPPVPAARPPDLGSGTEGPVSTGDDAPIVAVPDGLAGPSAPATGEPLGVAPATDTGPVVAAPSGPATPAGPADSAPLVAPGPLALAPALPGAVAGGGAATTGGDDAPLVAPTTGAPVGRPAGGAATLGDGGAIGDPALAQTPFDKQPGEELPEPSIATAIPGGLGAVSAGDDTVQPGALASAVDGRIAPAAPSGPVALGAVEAPEPPQTAGVPEATAAARPTLGGAVLPGALTGPADTGGGGTASAIVGLAPGAADVPLAVPFTGAARPTQPAGDGTGGGTALALAAPVGGGNDAPTLTEDNGGVFVAPQGAAMDLRLGAFFDEEGVSALALRIVKGRVPEGLSLNLASDAAAVLQGAPQERGAFGFEIAAVDSAGQASRPIAVSLTVAAPELGIADKQMREYILGYDGGPCFLSRPMTLGSATARIEVFGEDVAPVIVFDQVFKRSQGFEAMIEMRPVTTDQCALIDALNLVGPVGIDNAMEIRMVKDELASGDQLAGEIVGGAGARLFLFDTQGGTVDLTEFVEPTGGSASFELPLHAVGPQILIAARPAPRSEIPEDAGLEALLGAAQRGEAAIALGYIVIK